MNCTAFEEASLSRKLKSECQDVRDKLAAVKEVGPSYKNFSFFLSFSFYCQKQFFWHYEPGFTLPKHGFLNL